MAQNINIGPIVKIVKTDDEWKKLLAPMAYGVLRHENTERPFTDNMHDNKRARYLLLRGMRLAPLFFGTQVRQRHRLAQLLATNRSKGGRIQNRLQTDFPKDRSPLRTLRGASRTYL